MKNIGYYAAWIVLCIGALPVFSWLLPIIGIFMLARFLQFPVSFVNRHFFRKGYSLKERYGSGSWVCITGPTDGTGKALAKDLAKEGFNLVLIGRDLDKSHDLIEDINRINPSAKIEKLEIDFAKTTDLASYREIAAKAMTHDISMLINNVGCADIKNLHGQTDESIRDMININCMPSALFTNLISKGMIKRSKKSAIIHLSAVDGLVAAPGNNMFSATKAFVDHLSVGVKYELPDKIDVLTVRPFIVVSKHTYIPKMPLVPTPEQLSKCILRDVGHEDWTFGYWGGELQARLWIFTKSFLPETAFYKIGLWMGNALEKYVEKRKQEVKKAS